ncbi:MAG: type II toxin-antitoxin system VapC family toxin [Flavisolibacter sp.]|nr:type II toxin-antitoxin system VapC family toxin [Flavisolibacter sp.]
MMQEIQNPENVICFSQISLFEIVIKQKIGKLPLFLATIADIYQQALKDNFTYLPVKNRHIELYDKVPLLEEHRDPFDRLLIATALAEEFTIITADKNFTLYSELIKVLW